MALTDGRYESLIHPVKECCYWDKIWVATQDEELKTDQPKHGQLFYLNEKSKLSTEIIISTLSFFVGAFIVFLFMR
jgi:hypothetical protein